MASVASFPRPCLILKRPKNGFGRFAFLSLPRYEDQRLLFALKTKTTSVASLLRTCLIITYHNAFFLVQKEKILPSEASANSTGRPTECVPCGLCP